MKEYGIGIIGTGFMGKTHAYAYAAMPYYYSNLPFRTRLIGACSATEKSAEYAQSQLGFEYGTTDLNKLIGDERIDIIHICTPNVFHYEQVVKALEAGKHVYCDKPLAFTYEECVKLAELAREKQVTAQMGMQSRFFPATLRAKEIAEEGRLGDIICFRGAYLHSGSVDKEKKMGWKQGEGVGTLQDMGPHILDMIVNLTGPVE
ncbi:MAG: Gfo/Idh/MocA family oxidoreductase, partial [Eubacterium sp.]|nr:Gfo/Idh/MocA family oxidoreductase [Eubacterium sp.]